MQPVKVGLIKKGRPGGGEINKREAGGLKLINATIYDRLLIPDVQALQAEDPQFKAFGDIWVNYINNLGYGKE